MPCPAAAGKLLLWLVKSLNQQLLQDFHTLVLLFRKIIMPSLHMTLHVFLLQVRLFNLDVAQARAKSTIQIIGRKKISAEELTQGMVSSSAQRILEVLLVKCSWHRMGCLQRRWCLCTL